MVSPSRRDCSPAIHVGARAACAFASPGPGMRVAAPLRMLLTRGYTVAAGRHARGLTRVSAAPCLVAAPTATHVRPLCSRTQYRCVGGHTGRDASRVRRVAGTCTTGHNALSLWPTSDLTPFHSLHGLRAASAATLDAPAVDDPSLVRLIFVSGPPYCSSNSCHHRAPARSR